MDGNNCPICGEFIRKGDTFISVLGQKGCKSIVDAAVQRGVEKCEPEVGALVHAACRRDFVDEKRIRYASKRKLQHEGAEESPVRNLRKSLEFQFCANCFYCKQKDTYDERHDRGHPLQKVRTIELKDTVLQICDARGDEWANEVRRTIINVYDLHAADAEYHRVCYINFHTMKPLPACFQPEDAVVTRFSQKSKGRPTNDIQYRAFLMVMDKFQKDANGQKTVNELLEEMNDIIGLDHQPYGFTHMKSQIKEFFNNDVVIGEVEGRSNTVTKFQSASKILFDFHKNSQSESDPKSEKMRIIDTATKLIRSDIVQMKSMDTSTYPDVTALTLKDMTEILPESLVRFLSNLLPSKSTTQRTTFLAHSLMHAACPRSVTSPLLLGFGVQIYHMFSSRFLIDSLYQRSCSVSYSEVLNFVRNAAVTSAAHLPSNASDPSVSINYVADNVDQDVTRTIDGRFGFHGMGIIASITPGMTNTLIIARGKVNDDDLRAAGSIDIKVCPPLSDGLRSIIYKPLSRFDHSDETSHLESLWRSSRHVGWTGFMQLVEKGEYPGKSSTMYLPMIDLQSTDKTCVYSTLHYVSQHARQYKKTPVLTFDQPLYWKAFTIISNEGPGSVLRNIVLRIGVMHLQMSFGGSIGSHMDGSGLREVLDAANYGQNTITHIMSGSDVDKTKRAHQIINAALQSRLEDIATGQGHMSAADVHGLRVISADILDGGEKYSASSDNTKHLLSVYDAAINKVKLDLLLSRTGKQWLQYIDHCTILRLLDKAEHKADFNLHLRAVRDTLPILAATGHVLYAKTLYIYLQEMEELPIKHPEVHRLFASGHHVVRRSERFWSGVSTDKHIEQDLMRSLKVNGGLSRGRGWTEIQRLVWCLSRPHKDVTKARIQRDQTDLLSTTEYLKAHDPFDGDRLLRNVSTGVTAPVQSNSDRIPEIGDIILTKMEGQTVSDFVFQRKDRIVPMNTNIVTVDGDAVAVDPAVLFQRFISAGVVEEQYSEIFRHELCAYPAALFQGKNQPHQPDKSTLADAIWSLIPQVHQMDPPSSAQNLQYVIDGGWLLHRIPWAKKETFQIIAHRYREYIIKHFRGGIVVYDSYPEQPTTKDVAHMRRYRQPLSTDTRVGDEYVLTCTKEQFLSNLKNKQRFLNYLQSQLQDICITLKAKDDADVDIVLAAIKQARMGPVQLVGNDTDLLVLLLHYMPHDAPFEVYFNALTNDNKKRDNRIWPISKVKEALPLSVVDNILFAHALCSAATPHHACTGLVNRLQ